MTHPGTACECEHINSSRLRLQASIKAATLRGPEFQNFPFILVPGVHLCAHTKPCRTSTAHSTSPKAHHRELTVPTPRGGLMSTLSEPVVPDPVGKLEGSDLADSELLPSPRPLPIDGGIRAWLTVFGAFWALFATFGQVNAFGSFQAYYGQHQLSHRTASDISWIGSLQLWVFFVSGGVLGRLFDAHGPKYLLYSGTIVYVSSSMLTSICKEYYQFILCQGILSGLGIGLIFYPALSSVQTHFVRNRATATGITVGGSSIGGVVFPIMLEHLFSLVGFGWSVRVTGFICLACSVTACACCSSRHPPRKPGPLIDFASFKDAKFMLFALGASICSLGLYIPFFYLPQYASEKAHISSSMSFSLLSINNAASLFGRLGAGYAADRIGRFNLLAPLTMLAGIACLTLWLLADTLAVLVVFALAYGFCSGAFLSLTPPCVAQMSRPEQIGMRVGLAYALMSVPALVGGPIGGAILAGQHGSYSGIIVFAGVTVTVGASVCLAVKFMLKPGFLAKV